MRTIVNLGTHYYLKRIGILLVVAALVAGVVGCGGGPIRYDLTMAADPAAGGTATDGTDGSPYVGGTAVSIRAEANPGYEFTGWMAPAGGFADANAEETTFTMPAQDVTVTANFEEMMTYTLTMAADPAAGGTAVDETNESPYPEGAVISIKAEANPGYEFADWMAPTGIFADANAATTTFTMPAEDVTVTARFVGPLDHATCYWVDEATAPYIGEIVYLEDQFGAINATVEWAVAFANPAEKVHDDVLTPVLNPDHHLAVYYISYEDEPQVWHVEVSNQFGEQILTVYGPVGLAVPTQKAAHEPPVGLDHYLLYEVIEGPSVEVAVGLNEQFGDQPDVWVYEPILFANPVRKTHGDEVTEVIHPEVHGVMYYIEGDYVEEEVQLVNQFGEQTFHVYGPIALAVPSEKRELEPPEHPVAVAAVLGDPSYQLIHLLWANNIWAEERDWDVIADIGDYDIVVVNESGDPGSTDFQAFLDAASDNGVGVIFTSSYSTAWPWGISLLEWHLGDPVGQSEDYNVGDVYYKVTQEHPIFDGWDVGDEITIITGGDCDHTWFWGYSGDIIGEVGSADAGIQGDAVAVGTYSGSTHVLLSSLGPQDFTNVAHWTDDAKTIFINAVHFAASSAP